MAMIEIDHLVKRFGDFVAVDEISFQVERGAVLGFLGPNGAGKSTTMKMITGFLAPTAGTARVCGIDVTEHPRQAKARIGYLPEGAPTYPDMTPESFLDFCAAARGLSRAARGPLIAAAVARTELGDVLRQPIDTLSKGFKRRVGLAQAILHDPDVLILDEPTDGLDPNQKHQVRALIRAMAADKAIVISTHILEEVEAVCDQAVIIGRGRILAHGAPVGPTPDDGWRFGDHHAAPGRLDAVFRAITMGETPATMGETPPVTMGGGTPPATTPLETHNLAETAP